MPGQNQTILLLKLGVCTFLVGIFVPVLAQFKRYFPLRRLSVPEGIILSLVVFVCTLWFLRYIAQKHFKEWF